MTIFQLQFAVSEFEKSKIPIDIANDEFWFRQTVNGTDVYSTAAYFISRGMCTTNRSLSEFFW